MAPVVDNPHFLLPFRWAKGGVPVVDQGTPTEIQQNAEVILLTEKGTRAGLPELGIDDQAMLQNGADLPHLTAAVAQFEDRVVTEPEHQGIIREAIDNVRVKLNVTAGGENV